MPGITRSVVLVVPLLAAGCLMDGETAARSFTVSEAGPGHTFSFDAGTSLPVGFEPATRGATPPLGRWCVRADDLAPSAPHVLELAEVDAAPREAFHLLWQPHVSLRDLRLEARILARTGRVDQGGGILWRAQDPDHYYLARYNPLEANFRIYRVLEGERQMIASASGVALPDGEWFRIAIVMDGSRIQGWLNDTLLLEVSDTSLTRPGGIGLWAKGDASSWFDDVRAQPCLRLASASEGG